MKYKYGFPPKENWVEYCRLRLLDQMKRDPLIRIFSTSKHRAKRLGQEFTISRNDVPIPTHCPITELKLEFNEGKRRDSTYSLDRIDNSKGYIPGNVAIISWRANRIKSNLLPHEIENLYKYMNNKKE